MFRRSTSAAALLGLALAFSGATADERVGSDISPLLTTVGDPADPIYANAGANLRNGVGSIFIEFVGTSPGGFICTASVISPRHILTAAHCVTDPEDSVLDILFVLSAGLPAPMIVAASGFAVQPLYELFSPVLGAFAHGDVAVIELAEALPEEIEIYPLYTDTDEFNQTVRHYGHGRSGRGNQGTTGGADFFFARTGLNTYEAVLEPFIGTGIQDQLLSDFDSGGKKHNAMEWWFTSEFMCHPDNPDNPDHARDGQCTTFRDGSFPDFKGHGKLEIGTAPGDSGGPGFIDGRIAGVHSFGFTHFCVGITNRTDFNCVLDSSYGEMFGDTRVSSYATWIMDVVNGAVPLRGVPEALPAAAPATAGQASAFANHRALHFVENVRSRTLTLPVTP